MLESHGFQAARGVADICMLPSQRRPQDDPVSRSCRSGETGIRTGLKILWPERAVRVRPPSPAPRSRTDMPTQAADRPRCVFRLVGLRNRPALCMALEQYLGSD